MTSVSVGSSYMQCNNRSVDSALHSRRVVLSTFILESRVLLC